MRITICPLINAHTRLQYSVARTIVLSICGITVPVLYEQFADKKAVPVYNTEPR